ncbi:sphingomyelin phosphodiesterase A [Patella vulgata]|uniref:sphingomyelin phosphodiesterase A n=1 Tax=Patella vulgata TaxID=6465 RepID=UPI00217F5EAF|nr:sphingomyelin phosphodiesterase A [Patella vulgata]
MDQNQILILVLAATAALVTYKLTNFNNPQDVKNAIPIYNTGYKKTPRRGDNSVNTGDVWMRAATSPNSSIEVSDNLQRILEKKYSRFRYCHICEEIIQLINIHIKSNSTFQYFRAPAVVLCNRVSPLAGFDHSICNGIIDTYGPPLLYVADQLVLDPHTTCKKMSFCVPKLITNQQSSKFHSFTQDEPQIEIVDPMSPKMTSTKPSERDKPTETLRVLQISDIHVDKFYKPGSPSNCDIFLCCHEDVNGTEPAGYYGEYNCDLPWWTVDVLVDSIKQIEPPPDFIIYTGDSPPHDVWKQNWKGQLATDRDVIDFLNDRFDGINIYPTLGNHESFPANLYYSPLRDYQKLNKRSLHLWKKLFPLPKDQKTNIKEAAYYTALVKPGLRILSFNTNYGYTFNFYALLNWKNPTLDAQRRFMKKTLTKAKINGEKVIIIGHIPPGDVPNTFDEYGQFYTQLVTNYSDIIVLQLFGHTHRDQYEMILPDPTESITSGVAFIAPSVTTFMGQNPAYRIYHLDPVTFVPVDYDQYYLNITKANADHNPVVEKLYSAKEEYQLKDLSPQSFLELSKRFKSNETLVQRYLRNMYAGSDAMGDCDIGCKHITICETLSSSLTAWLTCVSSLNI